ncbi:putative indolepyruvate oxidoreductase subunit B [Komagataeibacter saccharivorans]|uniref:Putative indolepyruvate oxidoreductase subunit B n=2 Tax=Komagataeibacter saccharivorans TaxID=265959 RepID=A0A347WEB5_9PROT|nr:indolepyruvate oxidoreductase subunit beta family protein [Komagataeibacter saccharivorans]AXY23208.1 putative indolepyruvate oxidoreductase subunit B [Komagataeibacter saccharivorans]
MTVLLRENSAAVATKPISIAVCAMGGQGGGVLVSWIVSLAEQCGWIAQSTSVPGVAQRTGATIYYIEIAPADPAGRMPVLALLPTPGEVDIVLGAELMEGGRAMLRGLVTPERTTLLVSTHRSYAVEERINPGDGRIDPAPVYDAAAFAAKKVIAFDMEQVAKEAHSVISAVMLGALAASNALPFPRKAFEDAIRNGGIGVKPSLAAFDRGFARTTGDMPEPAHPVAVEPAVAPFSPSGVAAFDALLHAAAGLPSGAATMLDAGLRRVADFQDVAYADAYLALVREFALKERAQGMPELTIEAARHIANAMAYDDVIRVADLKTRRTRFSRIAAEMGVAAGQPLSITEFMHPRVEEVLGLLPSGLALMLEKTGLGRLLMGRFLRRGWRVRTDRLRWFVLLSITAELYRLRPVSLRHKREMRHRDEWLDLTRAALEQDYDFGVEVLRCRRLVKGYSDTHARGLSKFDRVMTAVGVMVDRPLLQGKAAVWTRLLREAALKDPEGTALEAALARFQRGAMA